MIPIFHVQWKTFTQRTISFLFLVSFFFFLNLNTVIEQSTHSRKFANIKFDKLKVVRIKRWILKQLKFTFLTRLFHCRWRLRPARIRVFLKPYIDTQWPRTNERIRSFRVDGGTNREKNSMHFQIKNILILVDVISSYPFKIIFFLAHLVQKGKFNFLSLLYYFLLLLPKSWDCRS